MTLARPTAGAAEPSDALPRVARLVWLVEVAGRYVPGRSSRCLRQALVLSWLLGRRGVMTRLVIGVARRDGGLVAHAWLERGGEILSTRPMPERYAPILDTGEAAR